MLEFHTLRCLSAAAAKRLELQRIGFRVLFMLQRRLLEELVFDNIVSRIQEALCESGLETRTRCRFTNRCFRRPLWFH